MEIEIQGIPQSIRPQYQARLRTAKADLTRYKKQYKDVHAQLARSALLSSSSHPGAFTSDEPYGPTSDRTRLLSGTQVLEDGTKRLQDSHRIALETENQGADILLNLRQQREQIINSRDTVGLFRRGLFIFTLTSSQLQTANTSIDRASGTLKGMIRRCDPPRPHAIPPHRT
jgi:vesicle transport through interaction with t-SNAREs protein 1